MFFSDYIRYALKGILSKKSRLILTVISICIGMTSVILITTIGNSGNNAVNAELDTLGLNGIVLKSKLNNLKIYDIEKIKDYLGNDFLVSSTNKEISTISKDNCDFDSLIWSGEEPLLDILNLKLLYGRGLRKKDIEIQSNVAIIPKSTSLKIFSSENSVGKEFYIHTPLKSYNFTVVGVVDNSNIYEMVSSEIPQFVYIPSSSMMNIFGEKSIKEISIVSKIKDADLDRVSESIIKFIEKEKGMRKIFYCENLNIYKKSISKIADIITLIITLIGSVSLIVGGFSVMNTMLVSVSERTKEIGIKKALGATNISVLIQFLLESLLITIIACLIGIISGLALSYFLINYFNFDYIIDIKAIKMSLLISIAMGIIFGVYPAYKASKLNPIDSLK